MERGILTQLELRTWEGRFAYGCMLVILLILAATMIYPFVFSFTAGLKSPLEIIESQSLLPRKPIWRNYTHDVWTTINMGRLYKNTVIIAAGDIVMNLGVSALAGYSFSRLRPAFSNILLFGYLLTLMVPGIVLLVPRFLLVRDLGLMGTYWGIWLPAGVNAFNILLIKSFFDGLPDEIFDAAKVDGASALRIFFSIALPMAKPIFIVLGILTFLGAWNDFLWPMLILTGHEARQPISTALAYGVPPTLNLTMAAYFIALTPPLVVALVMQRHLKHGLSFSGLTG